MVKDSDFLYIGLGLGALYLVYKTVDTAENAGKAIGQGLNNFFENIFEKRLTFEDYHTITTRNIDIFNKGDPEQLSKLINPSLEAKGIKTGNTPLETWAKQTVPDVTSQQFQTALFNTKQTLANAGFVQPDGKINFQNTSSSQPKAKSSSKINILSKPAQSSTPIKSVQMTVSPTAKISPFTGKPYV